MAETEYKNIKFTLENGVAHMILARHDIRNAFSERDFTDEILDVLAKVQVHPDVRVLVMSAEGHGFLRRRQHQRHERQKRNLWRRDCRRSTRLYRRHSAHSKSALRTRYTINIRGSGPGNRRGLRPSPLLRYNDLLDRGQVRRNVYQCRDYPRRRRGSWILPRRVGMQRAAELTFTGRVVGRTGSGGNRSGTGMC